MSTTAPVTFPDVERMCIDVLSAAIATYAPSTTVGATLPNDWTPVKPTHITVQSDGAARVQHPVVVWPTVRLTAWAKAPTDAKRIANAAMGVLVHFADFLVVPLTDVLSARDADHGDAELASITCRVTVRSVPLLPA